MIDDQYLVQRAVEGDQGAFSRLVDRHRERLYRLCYHLTGQAERAEELAHESCIEAWLKLTQLRDGDRFGAWVRSIALNLFRMGLRHGKPEFVELSESLPAPADQQEEDPLVASVVQGLSYLSYPYRMVLVLHYLEGLSYDDIATFLAVPVGTVMSRLHRGRKALQRQMAHTTNEEIPMVPEEFTGDVEAEVAVLLDMAQQDKSAATRLSILLSQSPEHFARLIAKANTEQTLIHLATLLRRFGRMAIELTVNSALTDGGDGGEQATRLLMHFTERSRQGAHGGPALNAMPPVEMYLLADAMLRHNAPEADKSTLLVTLLTVCEDEPTIALLTSLLLSMPDSAMPCLLAHYFDDEKVSAPILAALARIGTRFMRSLLPLLQEDEPARQQRALAGVEALARSWHSPHGMADAHTMRTCVKWAPIPAVLREQEVFDAAVQCVLSLLAQGNGDVRLQAIRLLGLLKAEAALPELLALCEDHTAAVRVAVLRALAEIGSTIAVPAFIRATLSEHAQERQVAVEALGRLQASAGEGVVIARVGDTHPQVRQAAVNALGDIGGEQARALLQQVMQGSEKAMARMAATALATSPHFRRQPRVDTGLKAFSAEVKSALLGAQVAPRQFIALAAAIAALPEVRSYPEREVTRLIAGVCEDFSTTRRQLIMDKLMVRAHGIYQLTDSGEAIWRVERFITDHYLATYA